MHIPTMKHRSSSAVERRSPTLAAYQREKEQEAEKAARNAEAHQRAPKTRKTTQASGGGSLGTKEEVLIVASRLKDYVLEKYGLRVSANVVDVLSDRVRHLADEATTRAGFDGRKTIKDRDVTRPEYVVGGPVLIIVSRFKSYVRTASEMNTAANVFDVLSEHVRILTDRAAGQAVKNGRGTLLGRDY